MSATKTITTLYNPGEKDKHVLINEFVIRTKEFDNIFGDIKGSTMEKPEQNYLLIGQRGSGKSTLIQRLRYAIEDDATLNTWLIPIAFAEEQYNITELGNLWERIAEYLEDYYNMPGIVAEIEAQLDKKGAEQKQLEVLLNYLRKNKKKLVLFIDNIGDMLGKFEDIEVKRLRSVLQTVPDIRLIAASPVMLDEITDYQKALFEYLKVIRLGGLSKEEMEMLLRKLGETNKTADEIEKIIKETPARIEILRRLTGGVPRTVVMMYNVFVENAEGNPIGDLQEILDEATPLYKHKMDDLKVQQQKIIDAVAKNWESISAGELAEKLRMESKIVSAQLLQLEKNQWIEKIETDTKNNLYQLQERFFNIWYLMRHGRRFEKKRIIWLVKFMESWLEKTEIENRIVGVIKKYGAGKITTNDYLLWCQIYVECEKISPRAKLYLLQANHMLGEVSFGESKWIDEQIEKVSTDFFEHPEKLNKNEIQEYCLNLSGTTIGESAEVDLLHSFEYVSNELAKDIWIKEISPVTERDKTGFTDYILVILLSNPAGVKKYIEQAFKKGNLYAISHLIQSENFNISKENLNHLFLKINSKYKLYHSYKMLDAYMLLLNDRFDESLQKMKETLNSAPTSNKPVSVAFIISPYFLLLISKQQFQVAFDLLSNKIFEFHETHKPIYYALMHYMKDEYPNEYLRMPPEMKETVEDVIKKIEEYKVKYA